MFELVLYAYLQQSISRVALHATQAECEAHRLVVRDATDVLQLPANAFCRRLNMPPPDCMGFVARRR